MSSVKPLSRKLRIAILDRDLVKAASMLRKVEHWPVRRLTVEDRATLLDFMTRCIDYDTSWCGTAALKLRGFKVANPTLCTTAHLLLAEGLLCFQCAKVSVDYQKAAEHFQNVLNLPASLFPGPEERSYALYSLARCLYKLDQHEDALQKIGDLRATDRRPSQLGGALVNALEGWIRFRLNDREAARRLFEAAVPIFREHENWMHLGNVLSALGRLARRRDLSRSEQRLREALDAFGKDASIAGHRYVARARRNLAKTLRLLALEKNAPQDRRSEALRLLEDAAKAYKKHGNHYERADVWNIRAGLLLDRGEKGDLHEAGQSIQNGYELVQHSQDAALVENRLLWVSKALRTPDSDDAGRARGILDDIGNLASKLRDQGNPRLWIRWLVARAQVLLGDPWYDLDGAQHCVTDALQTTGMDKADYLVRQILSLQTTIQQRRNEIVVFGTSTARVREIGLESAILELERNVWQYFLAQNRRNASQTAKELHIGFSRQRRIEAGQKRYSTNRSLPAAGTVVKMPDKAAKANRSGGLEKYPAS